MECWYVFSCVVCLFQSVMSNFATCHLKGRWLQSRRVGAYQDLTNTKSEQQKLSFTHELTLIERGARPEIIDARSDSTVKPTNVFGHLQYNAEWTISNNKNDHSSSKRFKKSIQQVLVFPNFGDFEFESNIRFTPWRMFVGEKAEWKSVDCASHCHVNENLDVSCYCEKTGGTHVPLQNTVLLPSLHAWQFRPSINEPLKFSLISMLTGSCIDFIVRARRQLEKTCPAVHQPVGAETGNVTPAWTPFSSPYSFAPLIQCGLFDNETLPEDVNHAMDVTTTENTTLSLVDGIASNETSISRDQELLAEGGDEITGISLRIYQQMEQIFITGLGVVSLLILASYISCVKSVKTELEWRHFKYKLEFERQKHFYFEV